MKRWPIRYRLTRDAIKEVLTVDCSLHPIVASSALEKQTELFMSGKVTWRYNPELEQIETVGCEQTTKIVLAEDNVSL